MAGAAQALISGLIFAALAAGGVKADIAKWSRVIKEARIQPE